MNKLKQISVTYKDDAILLQDLVHVRRLWEQCGHNVAICKIFATRPDAYQLENVSRILDEKLPGLLYYGCTGNGIINEGKFVQAKLLLRFTFYEDPTTRIETLQFDDFATNSPGVAAQLAAFCQQNPWVGSIELIASTMVQLNLSRFCQALEVLDRNITIFGGVACCYDMGRFESLSFARGCKPSTHTLVAVLRGGPNLHAMATKVYGWTPMGREFIVTKCHDGIIYELDHEPAFNIYRKYLDIEPDENLFVNCIEFPMYLQRRGQPVLLCSFDVNEDFSLNVKADIPEGTGIRLSYGDPVHLLGEAQNAATRIASFTPQFIDVFSCCARRAFWGDKMVSRETRQFNLIAPTTGFYSHGEILRTGRTLLDYNELLVIAAFREGPVGEPIKPERLQHFIDRRSYNLKLGHFIHVASEELEETVRELKRMAITDGLTQLYNRVETERRIEDITEKCARNSAADTFSLIMVDIDNFKHINDDYGHKKGDEVIRELSRLLREAADNNDGASAGRWGGEEFMLLLPWTPQEIGQHVAERLCEDFARTEFDLCGPQTVSLGVTEFKPGDTVSSICSRVDKALYIAKEAGKNRVCLL